jgi:hypothetical protein
VKATARTAEEAFHASGKPLPFHLRDFWSWSACDLVSNALRGVLAEFLVSRALEGEVVSRLEWDACDLRTDSGFKIEVKSAAYVQSWTQTRPADIRFGIGPTKGWNAATNTYAPERRRSADLYVFALLHHQDRATLDPMNVDQWTFFLLPTAVLNERCGEQKGIGLKALLRLGPRKAVFGDLAEALAEAEADWSSSRKELRMG